MTITVTPANFVSAFKAANSGDTLKLVGTFGNVRLSDRSFSNLVTLDATKAKFTNTLSLSNISNLKVSGGKFSIAGNSAYTKGAVVYGGSNIWFDKMTVFGTGDEYGVGFSGTTGIQVTNGTFSGLRSAVLVGSVTGGSVLRNKITGSVSDGIDIADSHGITASYNSCSGGSPGLGAHPDCIQLWSVDGRPIQSDITISYNKATGPTQGFTSFSNGGGATRVLITHNTVNTSYAQGVACYNCTDSTISFNTLSTLPGAAHLTNLNVIGGSNNTVLGNVINLVRSKSGAKLSAAGLASAAGSDGAFASLEPGANGVPEPSAWAMMLTGFALVGLQHRRRTVAAALNA